MRTAGAYAELAALFKYHGRHGQGLELLRTLSQDPGSLDPPPRGAAAGATWQYMRQYNLIWQAVQPER